MQTAARSGRWNRGAVIGVWLAVLLASIILISRTHFGTDLSAFLPASPDARQRVLLEQLQSGAASRTLLIGIEGGVGAKQRAEVSRALASRLRDSGLFEQVQNGDSGDWTEAGQWLVAHRYLLSPEVGPDRFTVEGLRDAMLDSLSLLGTPAGQALKPLLERDPTGETQRIAEGLIPASAPRNEEGVWVSREAPRALLIASTVAPGSDLDAQARAIAQVRTAFAEVFQPLSATATATAKAAPRLLLSGVPVFSVDSRDRIKDEAVHLAIVGGIVMSALLLLAFASLRSLAIALLPVATGVAVGTACVSLVFGSVHGLTMGFGSTLIGETVDYAIYYLIQARDVRQTNDATPGWRHWVRLHWPTVRLGLWTSVCGFAALVFSGFPGLAQLGVFSLAGLMAAALATRYVLPILAPNGAPGKGMRRGLAKVAGVIVHGLPRWRRLCIALCIASLVLLGWRHGQIWRGDLAAMSPVPQAAQRLDAQLRADLGASDARTLVVVQAADEQAALRAAEAVSAQLEPLVNRGELAGFDSVTRILPSEESQRARQRSLPDAATLQERLAQAVRTLPLTVQRLAPFAAEVEAARMQTPIRSADFPPGPWRAMVRSLMFERPGGGWSVVIALHAGAHFDPVHLRETLRSVSAAQVVDMKQELDGLYARYLHEAFVQVLLGAAAVVLLLGVYLRSGRRLLAVCQPLAAAVLITLGALATLNVALGILHLVGLLLVVAVGSNYALFFDQLQTTGHADEDMLASLLLANLTTVISFTLIAISDIPALSAIGRVVAPGALLALLLSAAFAVRQSRAQA